MAFQEVAKGEFARRPALADTVSVYIQKNGITIIRISGDLVEKIGAPVAAKLMTGTGPHDGFVAIIPRNMPAKNTYKLFSSNKNGKGAKQISIAAKLVGLAHVGHTRTTHLPHEITEDGLIVDVRQLRAPLRVAAE